MAVQLRFFNIPIQQIEPAEEKLNTFLKTVRVADMERVFVDQGIKSFWTVAVEFHTPGSQSKETSADRKAKIDYKAVLSPEEFALFAELREWRKEAAAGEGVPVYVIFTNEQLAAMAKEKPASPGKLRAIEGVGEARIEKYGSAVSRIISGRVLHPTPGAGA